MRFSEKFSNLLMALLILVTANIACVEKPIDPSDPSQNFAYARAPYDDEMYEVAITRLGEFKSRFPYSKNAPDAEIMIAHSHFKLSQYAEAAAAYEQFVKLHPRHAEADLAQYRIGESYWAEAPEEIDREQEFTLKAIAEWDKLVVAYPTSKYKADADKFLNTGRRRVADHSEFIAKFYCKREIYHACAYRYIELAEQYPQFKDLQKLAFAEAGRAFSELAKGKSKDEQSDSNLYYKSMSSAQLQQKSEDMLKLSAQITL
ncbi:MAG: outer membrane protein assembly factor BamD [Bdellovibrionota bacterium]|nr:MAG: outer membrane protein assembly factor BamD [Pseudomonadota bacterium]